MNSDIFHELTRDFLCKPYVSIVMQYRSGFVRYALLHVRHNLCVFVHTLYTCFVLSTIISMGYKNFVDLFAFVPYNICCVARTSFQKNYALSIYK